MVTETDLPELRHYRDTGCRHWHACLSCPFDVCLLESAVARRLATYDTRDAEMRRRHQAGESVAQLSQAYGITARTIYRRLGLRDPDRRRAAVKYAPPLETVWTRLRAGLEQWCNSDDRPAPAAAPRGPHSGPESVLALPGAQSPKI